MALLDRVATLLRANLNDLLDQAENPEKMLKQVIIDMENQFIQVKTQTAMALTDLHLLEKKKKESAAKHLEWMKKAELAVEKHDDELARAALERAMSFEQLAANFDEQIADQEAQVDALKAALKKLDLKLAEARAKVDLLIVEHRRSRTARRTANSQQLPNGDNRTFERMRSKIAREGALAAADRELTNDSLDARLDALERNQKINTLLNELKAKKGLTA
ncbi:MAG TPA: PspA/IM30 family protein [Candidatus Binataceae bacterium]|nr:PspA/IM30 family protein [Candidatus Binataceae bacterium]